MSKTKTIDLTSGPILKTLAELALPIMASSLLGTAYNITDMAWIGMLGSKAVAGVGVGGMYVWLSQGLVALPRMGGQVNVAQACGRGDYEQQGDMPLPLCDLHFYWEFYLLQYVSCLFIRCSAFLTSEMQKLIPLRNYIH